MTVPSATEKVKGNGSCPSLSWPRNFDCQCSCCQTRQDLLSRRQQGREPMTARHVREAQSSYAAGKQLVVKDDQVSLTKVFSLWVMQIYGAHEIMDLAIAAKRAVWLAAEGNLFQNVRIWWTIGQCIAQFAQNYILITSLGNLERHAVQSNMIIDILCREGRLVHQLTLSH